MNRFGLQSATMVKTCVPVSQLELFINCNVHTYQYVDADLEKDADSESEGD